MTAPHGVVSSRSVDFTPSRYAKGGSVCVLTEPKIKRLYPTPVQLKEAQIAEQWFRSKGFTISELPPKANYGFLYVSSMRPGSSSSATVIGNSVFLDRTFVHQMVGEFYSLKPSGAPDQLLWRGTATIAGTGPDADENREANLGLLLHQFPN